MTAGDRRDAQSDPALQAVIAGDNATALALTEGVTTRPPTSDEASLWHLRAYVRINALVLFGREQEALEQSAEFLRHAADVGEQAHLFALASTVWPHYLAGLDSTALTRLDDVIARAEAVDDPPFRVQALVVAASVSGWIGVTEVSDDLLTRVNALIDAAPAGVIGNGLRRSLRESRIATRLYLALACELEGSGRERELYAGLEPMVERTRRELAQHGVLVPSIVEFFEATRSFAHAALGARELPGPVGAGKPMTVPAAGRPFDVLGAVVEVVGGLARLRVAETRGDLAALHGADRLEALARRTRLIAMEAEACRLQLRAAQGSGDRVATAARQERFENAVAQLDWKRRVQRVHTHVFRARLLVSVD